MSFVARSLLFVASNVAVRFGVLPALLALALAGVVEPVPVGPAVLGRVGQPVGHGALGCCLKIIINQFS